MLATYYFGPVRLVYRILKPKGWLTANGITTNETGPQTKRQAPYGHKRKRMKNQLQYSAG